MKMKDFYNVLGVSETASKDEIKTAYKTLAKKYHPDTHPNDKTSEEKFKEVTEAFEILSDDAKRSKYDQLKKGGFSGFNGQGGDYSNFSQAGGVNFEDLFSSIFGGKKSQSGAKEEYGDIFESFFERGGRGYKNSSGFHERGEDIEIRLELALKQAVSGGNLKLKVTRRDYCDYCAGEGGSGDVGCPSCGGSGSMSRPQGGYAISQPCPRCDGRGSVKMNLCTKCAGRGTLNNVKQLKVNVPEGVSDGQIIRIPGEGHSGRQGAPRGNIIITLKIKEDEQFVRKGNDIYYELSLKFSEAALGCVKTVPTLKGGAKVNIPPGTKGGAKLKLRSMGVKNLRSGECGDQIITVSIDVPSNLSARAKELIKELDALT